jgi:hypothetical protein
MSRYIVSIFSLFLGLAQGPGSSHAQPDDIAALMAAAEGTYPAAQLTVMCVAIHPATATPMQDLVLLKKLGVHCARSDNNWDSIERVGSAGVYRWEGFDAFWSPLCKAGIRPIMIATYNNPIYAARVFAPVEGGINIAAFANFAVAVANHYISICPNMIEELFNEPNESNWTTVPWSGASYALMLAPVSAAVKAAQPRVTVYAGGLGFNPGPESTAWIRQMVGAGLKFPAVDAYAFHPYNYDQKNPAATLPPEQLLIDAKAFAQAAASSGQHKPVALTEYGFPLPALGGDLTKQGVYTARGMLAAIIGRYPLLTYYDLVDDGTDGSLDNTFGLFRNGASKAPYEIKPAGVAFAAIMNAMARASAFTIAFDPTISAPTISFEKPEGAAIVIWTYDAKGKKSYARGIGAFKHVSCKDVFGKTYPCFYADRTLSMSLSESSGPIVVTAQK